MQLNMKLGKTEMMIFSVSDSRRAALQQEHNFLLAGEAVRYVAQYRYLGCQVHERWLYGADFTARSSQVLVQTLMLRRQLDHLDAAKSVHLGLRLYDVKVRPSATYGACVWATRFHMVRPGSVVVTNELEKRHLAFIRCWCRLRGSEPNWLVYRELGRLPMHYYWWRDIVRFANRVSQLSDGCIWKEMLLDSRQRAREGGSCWFGDIQKFVQNVGCSLDVQDGGHALLHEQALMAGLCKSYDAVWDNLCPYPRQALERAKLATYFAWFDSGAWLRRPRYFHFPFPARDICTYLRFRLGSHDLQVELGRYQQRRPRGERVCERCSMHVVDDEWHMMFDCSAFAHLRSGRPHLFRGSVIGDMVAFMRQRDQPGVMRHILSCVQYLRELDGIDRSQDVDMGLAEEADSYDSD